MWESSYHGCHTIQSDWEELLSWLIFPEKTKNKKQNPQIFSYDPLSRTELQKKNQMHIKKKKTPISERFEKPQLLLKDSHVF